MHMQSKLLENRNKMLKAQGINETLFMALLTLDAQESHSIQPSELSSALGSSRTNATRIADELEKRGWIERRESDNDRRCLHLHLTLDGEAFIQKLLPPQHKSLHLPLVDLDADEQKQLETLTRKLLTRLDQMDAQRLNNYSNFCSGNPHMSLQAAGGLRRCLPFYFGRLRLQ